MFRLALHWQILIAMVLAAALGVGLNLATGDFETDGFVAWDGGHVQPAGAAAPVDVPPCRVWVRDAPLMTLMQIASDPAAPNANVTPRRVVITADIAAAKKDFDQLGWPDAPLPEARPPAAEPVFAHTVDQLASADPVAAGLFHAVGRSTARTVGDFSNRLGDLFLRMLKMVSIPLIITSLITGVVGLGKAERLGKMFGRTLLYYLTTSLLAICMGLVVFNIIDPGKEAPPAGPPVAAAQAPAGAPAVAIAAAKPKQQGKSLKEVLFDQIETMIPPNPVEAIANANFLSVISFSIFFAICTILVGGKTARVIGELFESAFDVMMTMTMLIIRIAPIGVFFLMLSATATQGLIIFGTLGWYMLTVAIALAVHAMVVLPLILHFVAKRSPWEFAKAMSPALLTAFSSASSNGTLPLTLTCVEERAKISNRVGSFVLPLGATINMDGTALYEVIAVMFIANLTPGVDLTLTQQIIIAYTALLASVGAAGIPHAGLVMMVIILQTVGLPTEQQGLIIAVDRVLDMCRTAVNVWSDSCGCAVISRFEAGGSGEAGVGSGGSGEGVVDV